MHTLSLISAGSHFLADYINASLDFSAPAVIKSGCFSSGKVKWSAAAVYDTEGLV